MLKNPAFSVLALVLSISAAAPTAFAQTANDPCAKLAGKELNLCRMNEKLSIETLGVMVDTIGVFLASEGLQGELKNYNYKYYAGTSPTSFAKSFKSVFPVFVGVVSGVGATWLVEVASGNMEYGGGPFTVGGSISFSASVAIGYNLTKDIDAPRSFAERKNTFAEDQARVAAEVSAEAKRMVDQVAPVFSLSPETALKLQKAIEAEVMAKAAKGQSGPYQVDVLGILKEAQWITPEKAAAFETMIALLNDVNAGANTAAYESNAKFTAQALDETIAACRTIEEKLKAEGADKNRPLFERVAKLEQKATSLRNRLDAAVSLAR